MNRIDALLYGRLRMSPSEAIIAYTKLLQAMPIRQAETNEELIENDDKFSSVFIGILEDVGLSANAPLRDDNLPCQT